MPALHHERRKRKREELVVAVAIEGQTTMPQEHDSIDTLLRTASSDSVGVPLSLRQLIDVYLPQVNKSCIINLPLQQCEQLLAIKILPFADSTPIATATPTTESNDAFTATLSRLRVVHHESLPSLVDSVVTVLVQRGQRQRRVRAQRDGGGGCYPRNNLLSQGVVAQSTIANAAAVAAAAPTLKSNAAAAVSSATMTWPQSTATTTATSALTMQRLNHNILFCKTDSIMKALHHVVGDDILRCLLLQTSMFVPRLHGNYLQICGPPLQPSSSCQRTMKKCRIMAKAAADYQCTAVAEHSPPVKKQRRDKERTRRKRRSRRQHPSTIIIVPDHLHSHATVPKRSLLYCGMYTPHVGLPSDHLLHEPPQAERLLGVLLLPTAPDDHPVVTATAARRPAVLTRQSNVWKRLVKSNSAIDVCLDLYRRHQRCDYARLLEHHCPLPAICCPPMGDRGNNHDASAVVLADAVHAYTPTAQVVSFVRSVLTRVVPPSLLGGVANTTQLLTHVEHFVCLRKLEQLPNKVLLQGIQVAKVEWLYQAFASSSSSSHAAAGKHQRCQLLVLQMLRWLVTDFVVPLLRATFYITDSEFAEKRVLYYRKPVWSLFRKLSLQHLLRSQYRELSRTQVVARLTQHPEISLSRLRLLPKETGVRPIAMLCKAAPIRRSGGGGDDGGLRRSLPPLTASTNRRLGDAFAVLRYEYLRKPVLYGAGLDGLSNFHAPYKDYIQSVRQRQGATVAMSHLFFGSVDIRHCYDNIDQTHLLTIVSYMLRERDYYVQRYDVVHQDALAGRVLKQQKSVVGPASTFRPFDGLCNQEDSYQHHHHAVLSDAASSSTISRERVIHQVREHLQNNVVVTDGRRADRYLLQVKGIPQGSILSSLLCNVYYGNVEQELFSDKFRQAVGLHAAQNSNTMPSGLLLRLIDDFLLVTTDEALLQEFFNTMYTGMQSRGVGINKAKSRSSVKMAIASSEGTFTVPAVSPHFFPWCGMLFDIATGEVHIDYTRFPEDKVEGSLSVDLTKGFRAEMTAQLQLYVRPRCLPALFDGSFQSLDAQAINFHQVMVFAAIKISLCLQARDASNDRSYTLLSDLLPSLTDYVLKLIRRRLRAGGNTTDLSMPTAQWLTARAFALVLCRSERQTKSDIAATTTSGEPGRRLEYIVAKSLLTLEVR